LGNKTRHLGSPAAPRSFAPFIRHDHQQGLLAPFVLKLNKITKITIPLILAANTTANKKPPRISILNRLIYLKKIAWAFPIRFERNIEHVVGVVILGHSE
jgi:hypothetical protein